MTFGEIYVQGIANGKRVSMARRVLYGDTSRGRQVFYAVLHECKSVSSMSVANFPDDIEWRAAVYGAGFQQGWNLGWAAAGNILQAHNDGQPVGVMGMSL